jgi:membrane protein DedA with SNARE-associated domain
VLNRAALWIYLITFCALVAAGLGFPLPEELPIIGAGVAVGARPKEPEFGAAVAEFTAVLDAAPQLGFPAGLPWLGLARNQYWTDEDGKAWLKRGMQVPTPPEPQVPLRWWIMLPLLILGVVISDGLLYGLGRFWGPRILETPWMRHLVPPHKRQRIEDNFHRYGVLVLLFARFLPTIRSPIYIMAGTMRLPFKRFVFADGIYAIPGVSLLFFLSLWLADQGRDLIERAEKDLQLARPILILIGIAAVGVYLLYHFWRHPVATGDPRQELPVIGSQLAAKIDQHEKLESQKKEVNPVGRRGGS